MRRKIFLASTCLIVLTSCLKDIDLSGLDFNFTLPPLGLYSDSLTSNKTFKMKVLEQGTNLPVGGISLKFFSNGYITNDSLLADTNGDIVITGRNVAPRTCLLSHPDFWQHGSQNFATIPRGFANYSFTMPRVDSIYRLPAVDSIVSYVYGLSYAKLHVSSSAVFEAGSYGRFYLTYLKTNGEVLLGQEFSSMPLNKDTTVALLILANQAVKVGVSLRKPSGEQIRFVETANTAAMN